jgi:ATP-binding cassette subfamily F protein uup
MTPPLVQLTNIALSFGGTPLLDGANLSVSAGERVCLVGRNGSGKSTLLKIAAGLIEADRGDVFVQPGAVVRYLPQEPDLDGFDTTLAYVRAALNPSDDPYQARYLLEQLGLTGEEHPSRLSGGELRRAALARVLAPAPSILLLDEPTNHLDLPAIEWLEGYLAAMRGALVIISHDRRFLENLSRSTVWLDRGKTRQIELAFSAFEAWRDEQLVQEELMQHKLDRRIEAEKDWMRYGVTARRKRNVKRVARLQAMRQERRDYRRSQGSVNIGAAQSDPSSKLVIEAKNIGKSFGGRAIVRDFSLRVMRGDRVGIVGPNGSGKTTLLNLLIGLLAPDGGEVRLGVNLDMTTLDQSRESLDPNWTLSEAMTGGRGDTVFFDGQPRHVVTYMKDFLFSPEQARTPLKALSGGERGRLMLARALAKPSNVLVLDEPTNDLDLETLDVLEEMLGDYAGTVLLISHDRDFLDRTVNAVIAPEGEGRWIEYAGGYTDMIAQRGADLAGRAEKGRAQKTAREPQAETAPKPAKKRLSFNQQHALKTLPDRISELEALIARLQERLGDPGLYSRDRKAFADATSALAKAQSELAAAEAQWLELEMLREEIEG